MGSIKIKTTPDRLYEATTTQKGLAGGEPFAWPAPKATGTTP